MAGGHLESKKNKINNKIHSGVKNRNLRALVTTDTELSAMAPPAIIGFNVGPPKM
jgi:hypothetical protein